jgi:uncharacterized membrane protein
MTRLLAAYTLVLAGALFIAAQDFAALAAWRRLRRDPEARGFSTVPLLGPLLCAGGLALLPGEVSGWCYLVPFALDLGTFSLLAALLFLIRGLWRNRA